MIHALDSHVFLIVICAYDKGKCCKSCIYICCQEEQLRDKPGYEHLNEQLHVLIEAEQPANVIDFQLNKAREIIEDLLKPVVCCLASVLSMCLKIYNVYTP